VIVVSLVAVALAVFWPVPGVGNTAFLLRVVINPLSRALERPTPILANALRVDATAPAPTPRP